MGEDKKLEEGQLSGSTLHSQIEDWRKGGSKFVAKIVEEADEIEELDEGKYHVLFEVVVRQRVRPKTAVHLNGRAEGKAATTYRAAGEEDKDRAADGRERPAAVGERVLKLIGEDRTLAREADERILITATKQAITKKKDPNTEMENAAAIEKNRIERAQEDEEVVGVEVGNLQGGGNFDWRVLGGRGGGEGVVEWSGWMARRGRDVGVGGIIPVQLEQISVGEDASVLKEHCVQLAFHDTSTWHHQKRRVERTLRIEERKDGERENQMADGVGRYMFALRKRCCGGWKAGTVLPSHSHHILLKHVLRVLAALATPLD
ncbi:hypothetical protein BLNAU_5623 [Blattamonas nauphoetae]|uniref:Uncharacterized protein n=1 Tax=Blattamonas nauphoetae TaxID=2049346 RepID=A0ABQ9Y6I8_9EUKA|nr:hypothetical protein BLNAU_5623 [Blattamonas nauphoetae]